MGRLRFKISRLRTMEVVGEAEGVAVAGSSGTSGIPLALAKVAVVHLEATDQVDQHACARSLTRRACLPTSIRA